VACRFGSVGAVRTYVRIYVCMHVCKYVPGTTGKRVGTHGTHGDDGTGNGKAMSMKGLALC
jgi:hypothetical protein